MRKKELGTFSQKNKKKNKNLLEEYRMKRKQYRTSCESRKKEEEEIMKIKTKAEAWKYVNIGRKKLAHF